jgi:acyl-CoA synthetase (NDP forming)
MDTIKLYGAAPANFLDVGGGATADKVTAAFKIMLSNPKVKAILVNIFGGIMKCDTIATGVVAAAREVKLSVPLVVRMKGTNEDLGKKILKDSGLPIISADNMAQAGQRIVAAIKAKKATPKPAPKPKRSSRPKPKPRPKAKPRSQAKSRSRPASKVKAKTKTARKVSAKRKKK